jgi:hypothetical protein
MKRLNSVSGPSVVGTRLAICILGAAFLGACATSAPGPIRAVSVRNAQFEVVKILAPSELPEFAWQWENKRKVEASPGSLGGQHLKLDVQRQGSNGRWLYQTTGYVHLLSMQTQPIYRLPEPETFNRLIGATQRGPASPSSGRRRPPTSDIGSTTMTKAPAQR